MAILETFSGMEISDIIEKQNKLFKEWVVKDKIHPSIYNRIVEIGVENIFVCGDGAYISLHNDDYCTFTYWDNVKGEFIEDGWTTAACSPSFDSFTTGIFTVEEAIKYNLFNKDVVKKFVYNECERKIAFDADYYRYKEAFTNYNKLVRVTEGRKWRGTGYLIDITFNGYTQQKDARILSLEDMQIHHCNPNYVHTVVNVNDVAKEYIEWATAKLKNVISNDDFDSFFITEGYAWCVKPEYRFSFLNFMEDNYSTPDISNLVANACDADLNKRKSIEFAKIVEWVKNKTDKTTENDINELAIKIFNKKYKNTLGSL